MNVKTVGWPMRRSKRAGAKASLSKPSPRLQPEGVLAFAKSSYDTALYLLPFDHRHSYVKNLFGMTPPLLAPQIEQVIDSKRLIYEGFVQALESGVPSGAAGVLVDEEFGADILRDARRRGFVIALSTETSGAEEFDFEYGDEFARHIETFDPTFAKALVRYNPEGDDDLNQRQAGRLKQLSDYCRQSQRRFMFELLVPATALQLQRVNGDNDTYDGELRPLLMADAIRQLQAAGVEPAVLKIEGLAQRDDCQRIAAAARCDGRDTVGCIVLGRTTFWDAVVGWHAHTLTRAGAVAQIALRLRKWVDTFERARAA